MRGLTALHSVGLRDEVLKISLPMLGRAIHSGNGEVSLQHYGVNGQSIHSVSRGELNKILLNRAEQDFGIPIHFEHQLQKIDFKNGSVNFLVPSGEKSEAEKVIRAKVFFGADGSASVMREEIQKLGGGQTQSDKLSHSYKELIIPAGKSGEFLLDPKYLHTWPRKSFMLISLPNLDGSFTATLFLPEVGEPGFNQLKSSESVQRFFEKNFPDFTQLHPHFINDFFENPTGHMVTIRQNPWSLNTEAASALLIGDAAHAIVPFFGQGMNCGFEDCRVLCELLGESGAQQEGWAAVFHNFFGKRKPNTEAIADLALENFIEMRDKVADPEFQFLRSIERKLLEKFPDHYTTRYQMVSFTNIDYAKAKAIGIEQEGILKSLALNAATIDDLNWQEAETAVLKLYKEFFT
jgi:kynurenine 3-monooxygenase